MQGQRGIWLFVLVAALVWMARPSAFITDSAYGNLAIARNIVQTGRQTLSGFFPADAPHPLWTWILAGYAFAVQKAAPGQLENVRFAIPLSAALLLIGALQFHRISRQFNLGLLWIVYLPLAYLTAFDVLYSEAPLYYCLLGALARVALGGTLGKRRGPLWMAVVASAIYLTRLDSSGLLLCLCAWTFTAVREPGRLILFFASFFALAVGYLFWHVWLFDQPTPIASWIASTFPSLNFHKTFIDGLATTVAGFNPFFGWLPVIAAPVALRWASRFSAHTRHIGWVFWGGSVWQAIGAIFFSRWASSGFAEYVLPMVACGFALSIAWHYWESRPQSFGRNLVGLTFLTRAIGLLLAIGWGALAGSTLIYGASTPPPMNAVADFIAGKKLHHPTVLVSGNGGYLAWTANAGVIGADMRSATRPLYEQMLSSGNALQYLVEQCSAADSPLRLVAVSSGGRPFLLPEESMRSIVYIDPASIPTVRPIGKLDLGPPALIVRKGAAWTAIWELPAGRR